MKRYLFIFFAVCLMITTVSVFAESIDAGIGHSESIFVKKNNTYKEFHTTVSTSSVSNPSVTIENTVQKKKSNGTYVNISRGYVYITSSSDVKSVNYSMSTNADVRSIWINQKSNSFVQGNFSLTNYFV